MSTGLVLKSTGKFYTVLNAAGERIECTIRGSFRIKGIEGTNPVAAGDKVEFETTGQNSGIINVIIPRSNYIIRKATNLSKQYHIIAANVDQALLIVTVAFPETMPAFIDRFLVSAEAYRIPAILVFNKTDLYSEEHIFQMNQLTAIYQNAGYTVLAVSAVKGDNIQSLSRLLKDKVSVIAGNSGVGKSTLINKVDPSLNLKTGSISDCYNTGRHITTFAEMFPLMQGGYIIDTPGIRAFGVVDMVREEIYHFFPEIFATAANCRFNNCMHLNEPGCAVIDAVRSGQIAGSRYASYIGIIEQDESKYR